MAEPYLSPLRIEIDPILRHQIDRICLDEGRSLTAVMLEAIDWLLESRGRVRHVLPDEDDQDG